MKIYLLNDIFSFFSSRKKASISSLICMFLRKKGIVLQTLQGKKYQVTNVGVEKTKLSCLLDQKKLTKFHVKHHSKI